MTNVLARFGPGMMLAAVGVGVSHLVQSTRAGAEYGLSLILLITIVVLLKYPAFRFGVDYACATGKSLVTGYSKLSKLAITWLGLSVIIDFFIAPAAVSLVTAGLIISIFDLPYNGPQVAVALMVLSAIILVNGQYRRAERIVTVLVVLFSILTLATTFFALPLLGSDDRGMFADVTFDQSFLIFVIAVTGWMPMPLGGSVFHSRWICEKKKSGDGDFSYEKALKDWRIGYGLTLVLAICFVIMGTAVLFGSGSSPPASAGAFATQLLSIFTTVFGDWMFPVIAAAALAVMWSTLIALMDGAPRITERVIGIAMGRSEETKSRYTLFLIIQFFGVAGILIFLLRGFATFIDFATSMGFLVAPAIAYYNYRAVTSPDVPEEFRPSAKLTLWSWIGVVAMTGFAVAYFMLRIF